MFMMSTMCTCGDNQLMAEQPSENVFVEHLNRKTGEPCPGLLTSVDMRRFPGWLKEMGLK